MKGPSTTVRVLPSKRTRFPSRLGRRPSQSFITPAFLSSSLKTPIAAICCFIGESLIAAKLASRSGLDLTKIMNFMFGSGVDVASVCHVVN